jgi:protein-tyrosine kinase
MSRIHEALKKAEQDRAAAQTADAVVLPTSSALTPLVPANEGPHTAVPSLSGVESVAPRRGEFLRLDDLRAHCIHTRWHPLPSSNVFADPSLCTHGAEQFRTLRSRLYQFRSNQTLRSILITSSVPAEGKTFVTSNLAQAIIRQPDRRALMIDGDLRRSRLHVTLGAPSSPGLSDYLSGTADEMSIIHQGEEGNLYFIPGGSEALNPSELLLNGRFKKLLDRITPVFDWVIIDSPPCLPVADANLLADSCDGVLLVVRAASTPTETARRACRELETKRVIGVVLNGMEEAEGYSSPYYDYGPIEKDQESR